MRIFVNMSIIDMLSWFHRAVLLSLFGSFLFLFAKCVHFHLLTSSLNSLSFHFHFVVFILLTRHRHSCSSCSISTAMGMAIFFCSTFISASPLLNLPAVGIRAEQLLQHKQSQRSSYLSLLTAFTLNFIYIWAGQPKSPLLPFFNFP